MMLHTKAPMPARLNLARLGDTIYYSEAPSAAQQQYLSEHGYTWEVETPRETAERVAEVNETVWVGSADPYIAGGGNPLYADPANIPTPPAPTFEDCKPLDSPCVQRNQQKSIENETLRMAYMAALNGAYDPSAPDRYVQMLNQYQATGKLPAGATTSAKPLETVILQTPSSGNTTSVTPNAQTSSTSGTKTSGTQSGFTQTTAVQPAVTTGGKAEVVTTTTGTTVAGVSETLSSIPTWGWLAIAGGAALMFFGKGNR